MEKRYHALAERVENLERENGRLKAINQLILIEKQQWLESKEKQNLIIQNTLNLSNARMEALQQEVTRLRTKLKKNGGVE